jgi:RNA-directed DNA polymerase
VQEGYIYAAELDIEKYFDRVNHDMVMGRLTKYVKDKRVLKIVRNFLQAGMWPHGVYQERRVGTPQGDDLDKELSKRGHKFCRYADDCAPRKQRRFI